MKLKRMEEDLSKFQSSDAISLENILGILQNVSKDVRKETGQPVENCRADDPDSLMTGLIWMGKLFSRIYAAHESELGACGRAEECAALEADISQKVAEGEAALEKSSGVRAELEALRARYEKVSVSQREYQALLGQKEDLEQRLAALNAADGDLAALKAEVGRRTAEADALTRRVRELQAQRDELEARENALGREVESLFSACGACQTRIDAQTEKKAELLRTSAAQKKRLDEAAGEIAGFEVECARVSGTSEAACAERDALKSRVDALHAEYDELKCQVDSYRQEASTLDEHKTGALSDLAVLEKTIRALKESIPADASRIEDMTAEKERLSSDASRQAAALAELTKKNETLEKVDIPAQRSRQAALEVQRNELCEALEKAEAEADETDREIDRLRQKAAEIDEKKKARDDELLDVREQLNRAYGLVSSVDENIKSLRSEIAELESQLEGKSEDGLVQTLEDRRTVLRTRADACAQLEKDLSDAHEKLSDAEQQAARQKAELEQTKTKIRTVTAELERARSELQELERRKDDMDHKERQLAALKQIHQALLRQAPRLGDLEGVAAYTDGAMVEQLVESAQKSISDVQNLIKAYVRSTNERLEEIK